MKIVAALALALSIALAPTAAEARSSVPTRESVARDVAASFPDDATAGWKIGAIERHVEGGETHFCVGVSETLPSGPGASYLFQYTADGVLFAAYVRGADGKFSLLFT